MILTAPGNRDAGRGKWANNANNDMRLMRARRAYSHRVRLYLSVGLLGLLGLYFVRRTATLDSSRQFYEPSGRLQGPDQDPMKHVPARIAKAPSRRRSARPAD